MKPVILLTGKTGQVGFELARVLPEVGHIVATDRTELNLADQASVRRVVRETRPQIIVNAAAYTAVDAAERDEPAAQAINGAGPGVLAGEARQLGALLVHYSTDYVFDGAKCTPYLETDATNPLNVYGKSKLAGEQAIRESGAAHLILRSSWVYATRGKNFLLTILRLAAEREELRVVSDQTGAPTCAWNLAQATAKILAAIWPWDAAKLERSIGSLSGTYHITAAGQTTWHGFAQAIREKAPALAGNAAWFAIATQGRPLIARRIVPITTAEFGAPALRPAYSVLSNQRLAQTFRVSLPDWSTQLERCLRGEGAVEAAEAAQERKRILPAEAGDPGRGN